MTRTLHALGCLALFALAPACLDPAAADLEPELADEPDAPAADERDDPFAVGKADGACVEPGSVAGLGVLALANDPQVTFTTLDAPVAQGGVGLDRRAAEGIVAGRPFADLLQLDAVPYVGMHACAALAQRACNVDQRCVVPLPVMSWNIEHFPLTPAAPQGVIDIVDELRPAIVGLQEVEQTAAFEQVLGELDGYTGILGEPGPFTRVGVLVDDRQLQVLEAEHLFVPDWFPFPRPVLAVRTQVLRAAEPTKVTIVVIHLKALSDGTSRSRRAAAVVQLREFIEQERAVGDGEIIIVGDWNDLLTDTGDDNVFEPLLDDAAGVKFLTLPAAEAGDATLIPFNAMLDHIMVTEEVVDAMPAQSTEVLHLDQTWSEDYEDTVSDHRPVLSVFGLPHPW